MRAGVLLHWPGEEVSPAQELLSAITVEFSFIIFYLFLNMK
jgi:hypothetical protein